MTSSNECVDDSCATRNTNFECTSCNTKDGLTYKTQQDECVLTCTPPFTEIQTNVCGVNCPNGQYSLDGVCTACNVNDCL